MILKDFKNAIIKIQPIKTMFDYQWFSMGTWGSRLDLANVNVWSWADGKLGGEDWLRGN